MAKRRPFDPDILIDPQKRAEAGLNAMFGHTVASEEITILDKKLEVYVAAREREEQGETIDPRELEIAVTEALKEKQVLEYQSDRHKVRLLILTRDAAVTNAGSVAQRRMLELSDMFAEIHVLVLSGRDDGLKSISRITENVWVYPTNSAYWWKTPFDAYRIAKEQLTFIDGFRADIVIAEDPFESGLVGQYIADLHNRPFQVHVFEDFYDPEFQYLDDHNSIRLFIARFVLRQADCVRTKSEFMREKIIERYTDLRDHTEILPLYYNLAGWRDATPSLSLMERYTQFKFIMLHPSLMTKKSHTDIVIEGAARILRRYATVGLVIVGEGPEYKRLQKQVAELGLGEQIIFEPAVPDLVSHMKSAQMFLYLSEDPEEEYFLLQAAASGIPIVTGVAGLPGELFLDGEHAFVCHNDSAACIGEKINRLLNENAMRVKLAQGALEVVFERVEQDYSAYLAAYRNSIERCLLVRGYM